MAEQRNTPQQHNTGKMNAQPDLFDWPAEVARKSGRDITAPRRDGETFDQERDGQRLNRQHRAVFDLMRDGKTRTLCQIAAATGYPEASISARLRDFRKPQFGSHTVTRMHHLDGIWLYTLIEKT